MEALNRVSAMTSEENAKGETTRSSYELADESIQMVLKAFQQQDDEEQGARLGRKNVQVMDRLAKMQAHKRLSIATIRDSYGRYVRLDLFLLASCHIPWCSNASQSVSSTKEFSHSASSG